MQYIITKEFAERLKDHLAGAIDEVDEADALYQELQSLPVLEGDPVGELTAFKCVVQPNFHANKHGLSLPKGVYQLYTQPTPFTPITADNVTDEMVQVMACYRGYIPADKEIIAAAVNAWGAKK